MEERVRAIRSEMQTAAEPAAEQSAAGSSTPEEGLRAVASAMERATRFEVAKQYREAEGVYREALQQHPENDEIRSALARVLSWQGSHGEATTLYRDVLGRHPEDQDMDMGIPEHGSRNVSGEEVSEQPRIANAHGDQVHVPLRGSLEDPCRDARHTIFHHHNGRVPLALHGLLHPLKRLLIGRREAGR